MNWARNVTAPKACNEIWVLLRFDAWTWLRYAFMHVLNHSFLVRQFPAFGARVLITYHWVNCQQDQVSMVTTETRIENKSCSIPRPWLCCKKRYVPGYPGFRCFLQRILNPSQKAAHCIDRPSWAGGPCGGEWDRGWVHCPTCVDHLAAQTGRSEFPKFGDPTIVP